MAVSLDHDLRPLTLWTFSLNSAVTFQSVVIYALANYFPTSFSSSPIGFIHSNMQNDLKMEVQSSFDLIEKPSYSNFSFCQNHGHATIIRQSQKPVLGRR